jgi:Holliday junction resolvase RusA-like endonuclease
MQAIAWEVRLRRRGQPPLDGPLVLDAHFYLRRPIRGKHKLPIGKPDRSNLLKLVEDALTDGGLWVDDALVLGGQCWKAYADIDHAPGVAIRVFRYTGGEA